MNNNLHFAFKNTKILRTYEQDVVLCDVDFEPHCGYMSFKEIEILQNVVSNIKGKWLEIGSHTGWSGAHVAIYCEKIYMVDPSYKNKLFKKRTIENLQNSNVFSKCKLFATDKYFESNTETFDGIIIDGNHDDPYPLLDAEKSHKILNESGCIILHDYNGDPIKKAVDFLQNKEYKISIFDTINGIAVCERKIK